METSGWILLDKPGSITSRAAGGRVGRLIGQRKFGHIGTLDPMASGLVAIAYGNATKMIPFMPGGAKEYLFDIQFGFETDTLDMTGTEIRRTDVIPSADAVRDAMTQLIGDIDQIPPVFCAVHVNGQRAYALARRGIMVDMAPRRVHIESLQLCGQDGNIWHCRVVCGTGTYVRSIARDIAYRCHSVATVSMIRRIQTNGFSIKNAVTLDFLENLVHNGGNACEFLHAPDFGLGDIPVINLGDGDGERYRNGGFIPVAHVDGLCRVYSGNTFIGMGMVVNNQLCPKRTL